MKAVVTGSTGHIGRYLVQRLAKAGWEVVAVSRAGARPEPPYGAAPIAEVRPLALDLCSEELPQQLAPELGENVALIHLAAWHPPATAASSAKDRDRLIEVNVLGTLRLLEAVRRASSGVRAVVYASTFEVYGVPQSNEPVSEDSPTEPFSDYGASKLAGEDHLLAFGIEQNVRVVALRLPAIYGPSERVSRALPNFLKAAARGERPTIYGDGSDRRDQLHAADAALAVERAVLAEHSGIYNASDGEPHSILELSRTALRVAGLDLEPELLPANKPRFDFHMTTDKIRRELGFSPQIALEDGMREQLEWLRSLGADGG